MEVGKLVTTCNLTERFKTFEREAFWLEILDDYNVPSSAENLSSFLVGEGAAGGLQRGVGRVVLTGCPGFWPGLGLVHSGATAATWQESYRAGEGP